MTRRHRTIRARPIAAALLACLVAAAPAPARDDDAVVIQPVANEFTVNATQFDMWVFGVSGGADAGRRKADSLLSLHVAELERECHLSSAQKKKLLLAGRGDVKRFFDRVDTLRTKYVKDRKVNMNQQNDFQQMWQEIQPLNAAFEAGLFNEGTLYAKMVNATLTPEQAKEHERAERERLLYRYRARIDLGLELLNQEVGFTDEQHRKLMTLLNEETKPPRRLGKNDRYLTQYQLSRIPKGKIRPIFDDAQWRSLERSLDQGRAMENVLKLGGFVPADAPEGEEASRGAGIEILPPP